MAFRFRKDDRTKVKDRRKCREIWTSKNIMGTWYIYGTWGRGKDSVTRTLGYRMTKRAADNVVKAMKRLYY